MTAVMAQAEANNQKTTQRQPRPSADWRRLTTCSSMRRLLLRLPETVTTLTTASVRRRLPGDNNRASAPRQQRTRSPLSPRLPRPFRNRALPWPRHSRRAAHSGRSNVEAAAKAAKAAAAAAAAAATATAMADHQQNPRRRWRRSGRTGPSHRRWSTITTTTTTRWASRDSWDRWRGTNCQPPAWT